MRWLVGLFIMSFALMLWGIIDANTPQVGKQEIVTVRESQRENLTPEQCRLMAEHLRRDHGLKVRVLSGTQVITGAFVWQDLTVELIDHPGFVFSYPHYLGNLRGQEILEEIR